MNEAEVQNIIEIALNCGNKTPGLFDLPIVLWIKSKLEPCIPINEVAEILEDNRAPISKSFGLSESIFDAGLVKLKKLEVAAA